MLSGHMVNPVALKLSSSTLGPIILTRAPGTASSVDTAQLQRDGDAIDGQHISGDSIVDAMGLRVADYFVKTVLHNVAQAFVDFAFAPEKPLPVLHPLKVADAHAACVCQYIRNNENTLAINYFIGQRRGRAVSPFANNLRLYAMSILRGDLILYGRRQQNLAWLEKNFLRRKLCAPGGKFRQGFALRIDPINQLGDVEPFFVVERPVNIRRTNYFVAGLVHQHRCHRADVSEALHNHPRLIALQSNAGEGAIAHNHAAAAGCFFPPPRPAQLDWFSG